MSFMFGPYPYDDPRPVNPVSANGNDQDRIVSGARAIAGHLSERVDSLKKGGGDPVVLCLDGYVGADSSFIRNLFGQAMAELGTRTSFISIADFYRPTAELDDLLRTNLWNDPEWDPVSLFGKIFDGTLSALFADDAPTRLQERIHRSAAQCVVVYGSGAAAAGFREMYDIVTFLDVPPKEVVLRFKRGGITNLGDSQPRRYKQMLRRAYYFDFEIVGRHRKELLENSAVHYYLDNTNPGESNMVPIDLFSSICRDLVQRPLRCKPVYNEGVWGGYYTMKYRNLPVEMQNCAWVFDMIPSEVSVLAQVGNKQIEIPYFTVVQKEPQLLMGKRSVDRFGPFFPVRFNYDDTIHSNGNMSIQVHPPEEYAKHKFGEHGRQDESYYVVATGHGAKTYMGLRDDCDTEDFWRCVHRAETEREPFDYDRYVNSVASTPGTQFLIPAGTIHASGRNQLILEIGSLTVGSYTFKLYDYLRKDLDGKPRPIHSRHGKEVLDTDRRATWVQDNLVPEPRVVWESNGAREVVVGEHDFLYFSLRRLEFFRDIRQHTEDCFHVLALVDGERVRVQADADPERAYTMCYLEIVVVPASIGPYTVTNLGDQPVVVHKTTLKDGDLS